MVQAIIIVISRKIQSSKDISPPVAAAQAGPDAFEALGLEMYLLCCLYSLYPLGQNCITQFMLCR
jgi:hypothetical protein